MLPSFLFFAALCAGISAQSQSYTPTLASCPDHFNLLRPSASDLSANESAYISSRDSTVLPLAWNTYLQILNNTSASLPPYLTDILSNSSNSFPRLAIAISGGGYRAAIFGAGVLNALDARNHSSSLAGAAGLLQAASYLSALSGGSWLLSSALQANFPTIHSVVFGPQFSSSSDYGGWNAQFDLIAPANSTASNALFYLDIISEISGKHAAGFPVTITDVWARLLARHFCNGTQANAFFDNSNSSHGAGILLSGLTNLSTFQNHQVPFPIITADSVSPRQNSSNIISGDVVPLSNTVFEFTPFEMGSFDPTLAAFTPTQFLGTTNSSLCVTGFDQLSFISGTSSELFNEFNTSVSALAASTVGPLFALLNESLPEASSFELDVSLYPNPFFGVSPSTFIDSNQEYLRLVDGGEDGQVIPLQPLLVKARQVDVIFAIDASADTSDNFPGGISLIATQNRTALFPSSYSFPKVPETMEDFLDQNLTAHPTFFGCNDSAPTPLVIYLANTVPPGRAALTNTSTEQTEYENAQIQAMLDETFLIATQGFPANASQTVDPDWPACLACAVVDRARARQEESPQRSGICETCFSRYCWFP